MNISMSPLYCLFSLINYKRDAAHTIHPMAGQGLNLGFADANFLAKRIVNGAKFGQDIGK